MLEDKEFDERLGTALHGMAIPQPDAAFENRIIMAAMAQHTQAETPVSVHQGKAFTGWWNAPRVAFAAALAAVALVFLVSQAPFTAQLSEQQIAQERYTVDGVGLLADVDVVEMDVASDSDDTYDLTFASF